MGAARNAVLVRTNAQRVSLDARLTESQRAFEAWLAEERRGQAKSARPDPIGLMDRQDGVDDHALLNEVVLLNESLAEAKAREDELSTESQRLSAEVATISAALAEAKAHEDDLKVANAEFTRVSERLSEVSRESQRLRDEKTPGFPPR
jgi:seryl-tRNA synthetase